MTINVAVVTSEAIVLGCDSIASSSQPLLDPFGYLETTSDGSLFTDENGNWVAKFPPAQLARVTTHARSGVTKMFRLYGDGNPVAGTTAGLAALNGKNIAECVDDYRQACKGSTHTTVAQVVEEFSAFMGDLYEQHFSGDSTPAEYRDDVEFLVGGYGAADPFPSLYRINLRRTDERYNLLYGESCPFGQNGVAWAGQSDAVERVIFGYDIQVRNSIEQQIKHHLDAAYRQMSVTMASILERILHALTEELPADVDTSIPMPELPQLDWRQGMLGLDMY